MLLPSLEKNLVEHNSLSLKIASILRRRLSGNNSPKIWILLLVHCVCMCISFPPILLYFVSFSSFVSNRTTYSIIKVHISISVVIIVSFFCDFFISFPGSPNCFFRLSAAYFCLCVPVTFYFGLSHSRPAKSGCRMKLKFFTLQMGMWEEKNEKLNRCICSDCTLCAPYVLVQEPKLICIFSTFDRILNHINKLLSSFIVPAWKLTFFLLFHRCYSNWRNSSEYSRFDILHFCYFMQKL